MKKLIQSQSKKNSIFNDDKPTEKEVVHVIISEEENEALQKLKAYENEISKTMQKLMVENEKLIENENKVKSEINAKFNNLINVISMKQEQMLNNLKIITQKNQSKMNANSQILKQQQIITKNAIKSCEYVLKENNEATNQRKQQVLSIQNEALKDKIKNQYDFIHRPDNTTPTFDTDAISIVIIYNLCIYCLVYIYLLFHIYFTDLI